MTTRLALLGSTGSIGRTCLRIAAGHPGRFQVLALAAGTQWELLAEQVRAFRPSLVSVATDEAASALREALAASRAPMPTIAVGEEGLRAVATCNAADIVVSALTGGIGVVPTVAAVRAGKDVALANKEALVIAGEIIARDVRRYRVRLLPVDSEISAIWQCLEAGRGASIRRILLTASGGPFRDLPAERFPEITPEQALAHPTWVMGRKVSVDSATLMNKGFEVFETRWLFDMPLEKIEVLIHRESVVHSLVEYADGSIIAQLGVPDMTLPIQYALTYPERLPSPVEPLDLAAIGSLTFAPPDTARFPALALARHAAEVGGTMPAVLSGADEVAVAAFLSGRLLFTDIATLVEETMARHESTRDPSLDDVRAAERWAKATAQSLVGSVAAAGVRGRTTPRSAAR